MRRRLVTGLPLLALWVVLASVLSVITASVRDWNAMTDELVYERLAISVAQTHSIVPHLHGQFVRSLGQLYPLLISPWFLHGYVPHDLTAAHIFNAWLMSSACVPAFFLARRVTGRLWIAYAVAFLTVCTPWIIYATTLLTEVAAFPAFMWALLAIHKTMTEPSRRNDALALLAVAVAFFARTEFVSLVVALPAAVLAFELARSRLRGVWRRHAVLAAAYGLLALGAVVLVASGHRLTGLSVYGNENTSVFPPGWSGSITRHLADLAFGVGVLPLVAGVAWMYANVLRPPASAAQHGFACLGGTVFGIVILEISAWDLGTGLFVIDRFLFYLAPVVVLAFFCAVVAERRPRWSLVVPAALVAYGFAAHLQSAFLWSGAFPVSTDSPIAPLYKPIADLFGGMGGASWFLALATLALAALFAASGKLMRRRTLVVAVTLLLLAGFAANTAFMFDKLFSRDGHSFRPLTQSESGLAWIDRTVGTNAQVTEVPYPISSNVLLTKLYWRDIEFWNKSVRYGVHVPSNAYRDAVIWFPNNPLSIDPATGSASPTLSPYAIQAVDETRFRISGEVIVQSNVMLIKTAMPWRVDWLTDGLYDDGWTQPGLPARIRVFSTPDQHISVTRTLTVQLRAPDSAASRPFALTWPGGSVRGVATNTQTTDERIAVCVPARGYTDVRLAVSGSSAIPGDQGDLTATAPRAGGLLVADISVADEVVPSC